ncbi:hypothetical protein EDC04DRAFT_2904704 [Pisolithus marmoratus]|nr:hypothetical protein EDC04DRAFT_2904704 [Pisolithus marmoratus]
MSSQDGGNLEGGADLATSAFRAAVAAIDPPQTTNNHASSYFQRIFHSPGPVPALYSLEAQQVSMFLIVKAILIPNGSLPLLLGGIPTTTNTASPRRPIDQRILNFGSKPTSPMHSILAGKLHHQESKCKHRSYQ